MRNLLAALCVATLPLAGACAPWADLPSQVEALKPRDARSALSEAEILFVGVINSTDILAARGVLSNQRIAELVTAYQVVAVALDEAHALLKAGEAIAALARIDFAHADLRRIADALSRANEAAVPFRATPSIWQPMAV